jgi:hypothetical protein
MFCQRFLKLYGINPNLPIFVIYTDKVHFTKDGIQNVHNRHVWTDVILPSHHQQRFSINIWAGTCGDNSFGPHILLNSLTWQNYKAFLGSNMPDFLADMLFIIRHELHFKHDAAPAYFSLLACRFLIQKFPGQCIGRGGPFAWFPCSHDLNPLDLYLWDHLKLLCIRLKWMMWKLSEIELRQILRQYITCQKFGIVFRWQWDVELKPTITQEEGIWNIYCKATWTAVHLRDRP